LNLFLPGTEHEFTGREAQFKKALLAVTEPLGIKRLRILNTGCAMNENVETMEMFPHRRIRYGCGSCDKDQKQRDESQRGCCGFMIQLLLVNKEDKAPHLQVRRFNLPPTSNHVLVSEEARAKSTSKVIDNEDQLTPTKTNFLKNLGKNRVASHTVRNMMQDQFNGLQVERNLANRVMRKGRNEAWGVDDDEAMIIFYAEGLKLCEEDSKLGIAGKFMTRTDPNNGILVAWLEQTPLEVANARVYGKDAVWVDTTHNATKFNLKTGPVSVADWGGNVAPAGLYMVREEEIELCKRMQAQLELDVTGATCGTDGGTAWPEIVREFDQRHIEDTFHNDKNGELKAAKLPQKARSKFSGLKYSVLYLVHTPEELTDKFCEMRKLVGECNGEYKELLSWIDRIEKGQEIRAATHTTKHFCCSLKGATSRCEVSMSKLKASGNAGSEMRKWSLPEIQHRHRRIVDDHETDAKKEIEAAIKEKRVLSNYVLEKELEELNHVGSLEMVEVKKNTPNPFHGVLQSSKKTFNINIERTPNASLGITLVYKRNVEKDPNREGLGSLEVIAIAPDSPCHQTQLQVGMLISKVNGETFASKEDGVNLINAAEGHFTVFADTVPMMGTVYTIQRKGKGDDQKMLRTVFIPDSTNGLAPHCQSDYHCHTAFWIRCRYIQRALLEHHTRSMDDLTTIHSRWHIRNSPLYQVVHDDLVAMMKIDGLGNASLPAFLDAASPAEFANKDDNSIEETIPNFTKPTTQSSRYNNANALAGRIVAIAKVDPGVYRMVMPQLEQIYQNSVQMRECKSAKTSSSQQAVTAAKASLPIVPESLQTNKSDDVNLANKRPKKKRKGNRSDVGGK
jgi:hypothetical protein